MTSHHGQDMVLISNRGIFFVLCGAVLSSSANNTTKLYSLGWTAVFGNQKLFDNKLERGGNKGRNNIFVFQCKKIETVKSVHKF